MNNPFINSINNSINKTELIFKESTFTSEFNKILNVNKYITKNDLDSFIMKQDKIEVEEELNNNNKKLYSEFKSLNNKIISTSDIDALNGNYYNNGKLSDLLFSYNDFIDSSYTDQLKFNNKSNYSSFHVKRQFDIIESIFLEIRFKNELTQNHIIKLLDCKFELVIGGQLIHTNTFINSLIFALIHEMDINLEQNLLRIPIYDFTTLECGSNCESKYEYGLPLVALQYHDVKINIKNFNIDSSNISSTSIVVTGKYIIRIGGRHKLALQPYNLLIWFTPKYVLVYPNIIVNIDLSLITQFLIFYIKPINVNVNVNVNVNANANVNANVNIDVNAGFNIDNSENLNDIITTPEIISIGLSANKEEFLYWNCDELLKFDYMDLNFYVLCLDSSYKNKDKFINYFRKSTNNDVRGVNFSGINSIDCLIQTDSDSSSNAKKFECVIIPISLNYLAIASGMAGLRYSIS
jgi:hypothetical protein